MKNLEAKRLLKALGIGLLFGFVTYILSGESGASVGLFLLMAYLEYKLK
jgi:hypothetical protein